MSDFKISEPGHETILCTENLTRTMGEVNLVDSVSISIACCQVVAIVGPSGAGKSSFLRLLNRLDEPTRGTVEFRGQDYRQIPPRTLRQKIGMVMQAPNLFPGTVADNIRFGPLQRGEDVTSERLEMLLERVGLHGYASRDALSLSGGEAQRVSLARTLANSPEILLLDEPTSALDDSTEQEVESLITGIIREQSLTCLIITHDWEQARRVASHAMLMEKGRLVRAGVLREVLHAK
jgi:putative ABC transport system ATP-binding protein